MDLLADRLGCSWRKPLFRWLLAAHPRQDELFLVKPLTFMNRSGEIFPGLWSLAEGGEESLVVVCDTLDLPPGQCRLRRKGSSGGHKGLASIISSLGRSDFLRLVIGIGRPVDGVVDFVLSRPQGREAELIDQGVAAAAAGILRLLAEEPEKVMNDLNQVTPQP